jgi:predicted HAD superfamily hydrolase
MLIAEQKIVSSYGVDDAFETNLSAATKNFHAIAQTEPAIQAAKVAKSEPFAAHAEILRPLIEQADIVSFDVFDTLLVRPFVNPTDVFLMMERRTGIIGFHDARIQAEITAREDYIARTGSGEVTLEQIYAELKLRDLGKAGLAMADLQRLEIETEKSLLKRSPFAGAVYDLACAMGKTVIAVSDMYLPEDMIGQVLADQKLPVTRVFVSCAYRAGKHEGRLYDVVAQIMGVERSRILHFGDNFKSDCSAALQAGVAGYYLPSLYDQLYRDTRYNQYAISKLHNTAPAGKGDEKNLFASALIAYLAQFKAAHPQASMAEQFGAMYGGPMVAGFASWMNVMMQADQVKHLRLATRDGYITKQIWDRLGFSGAASILQSSRRLTLVPALHSAFEKELGSLLNTSTACTLRECISRLALGDEAQDLLEALGELTPLDQPLNSPAKNASALDALKDCQSIIKRIAAAEMAAYKKYLEAEGFDPQTDAMVDCGWALSSQRRTERMLGEEFRGYYVGTLEHAHMHDKIRSFLFHKGQDKAWVEIAERAVELLELPFTSMERQVGRFRENGDVVEPVYLEHETQYDFVRTVFVGQMQSQICSFADFIKPLASVLTLDELRQGLFILFEALVNHPTPYEYHELAALPHNRELGASGFATIGTFWIVNGNQYTYPASRTGWRDYVRLGLLSFKQAGPAVTWMRIKRVLRRKVLWPLKAAA